MHGSREKPCLVPKPLVPLAVVVDRLARRRQHKVSLEDEPQAMGCHRQECKHVELLLTVVPCAKQGHGCTDFGLVDIDAKPAHARLNNPPDDEEPVRLIRGVAAMNLIRVGKHIKITAISNGKSQQGHSASWDVHTKTTPSFFSSFSRYMSVRVPSIE